MPSIFTQIIRKEIPAHIVAETADCIAFLDVNPNVKGHTLCVPKIEVDKITDLPDQDYLSLMAFSKKVAIALESVVPCKRIGFTVIGLEVPHVHVHLIPLNTMADATFSSKEPVHQEDFKVLSTALKKAFNAL